LKAFAHPDLQDVSDLRVHGNAKPANRANGAPERVKLGTPIILLFRDFSHTCRRMRQRLVSFLGMVLQHSRNLPLIQFDETWV
jgi:hypothetical protein